MNLFDLTITQLKRATAIKEQIEALNKELRSILGASAKSGTAPKNKADNERSYEKEDCGCSKSKVGEPSTSETSDAFSQTRCEG